MKYLILCDLEGTILNNKNELSDYTIKKVKEISENHHFCLVTSTSFDEAKTIYDKLSLDTFLSCENSSLVINPKTNKSYNSLLDKHFILELFNLYKNNLISMFYKNNNSFFAFEYIDRYKMLSNNENCNMFSGDFNNLNLEDTSSLFLITTPDTCLDEYCLKHNLLLDCYGKDKTKAIYKISSLKASKYENCLLLKSLYEYDEIIAIGDSPRDLEMLSLAHHPILMKNTSVKNSYSLSEFDNNNDGAIKEILKLLKK